MIRAVWFVVGAISLVLGLIGLVMPIMPTTPFMIVAAAAFAKSSPRLNKWILDHPAFGPPVRDWQKHGAISPFAKRLATGAMICGVAFSALMGFAWQIIAVQAAVLTLAAAFVLTRPDPPSAL